ncbi:Ubiquitin carboxyl-terminal hydrolase MINDY-1 [Chlorella vulgaris]
MAETNHKVKVINFKGRRVPIMLQDINGPCPLLAIANVLLLRNQLQLPSGVGEVSQARLVEMVAGRLLDVNSLDGKPGVSEDHVASLQQHLAEAIGLLPQLCTGVDVNPRLHDIRGFEYTRETAVFDLLDIQLVHGWVVDPQDTATAAAIGAKSYNELTVQLVTALGNAATPKRLTPTTSLKGTRQPGSGEALGLDPLGSSGSAAAMAAAVVQQHQQAMHVPGQRINAAMLSAALRDTLHLAPSPPAAATPQTQREGEASSGGSERGAEGGEEVLWDAARTVSHASMNTSDSMLSMHSVVNRMLTDLVADAFTATPATSRSTTLRSQRGPAGGGAPALLEEGSFGLDLEEGGNDEQEATSALQPSVKLMLTEVGGQDAARPMRVTLLCSDGSSQSQLISPFDGPAAWASLAPGSAGQQQSQDPATPPASLELRESEVQQHVQQLAARQREYQQRLLARLQEQGAADGAGSPTHATLAAAASDLANPQAAQQAAGSDAPAASTSAAEAAPGGGEGEGAIGSRGGGGNTTGASEGSPGESAVRDALLVQQFLDSSPSQLTYHGLAALHEGLRPNQLAVFFRCHFNTVFRGPGDQLFILATDEGFQFEADVVWEALDSVDGDTQLVDAEFRPFRPHASQQAAQDRQAAAQDAEWAEVAAAAAASGGDTHDADMALAMQLQAEEEERVQLEQQRRQQAQARQQEEQRRQAQHQAQQQQQQQQQAAAASQPAQRRASSAGSESSSAARKKKEKKSSSDCCIQ